ncbi:Uncharacterised protein [uncultured archaeon]|nr:Uncharacterised protein [uncultured archaeon]
MTEQAQPENLPAPQEQPAPSNPNIGDFFKNFSLKDILDYIQENPEAIDEYLPDIKRDLAGLGTIERGIADMLLRSKAPKLWERIHNDNPVSSPKNDNEDSRTKDNDNGNSPEVTYSPEQLRDDVIELFESPEEYSENEIAGILDEEYFEKYGKHVHQSQVSRIIRKYEQNGNGDRDGEDYPDNHDHDKPKPKKIVDAIASEVVKKLQSQGITQPAPTLAHAPQQPKTGRNGLITRFVRWFI